MDERKQKILQAIINCYVSSGEPIGSRTISRRYNLGISPATIRNEMSDLEESGYLEQPHTSAGRIPSHKGYRFYVDRLMKIKKLKDEEIELIKSGYRTKPTELEYFINLTAKMLSSLTNYTAVALKPIIQKSNFKHLQLIPLSKRQVLMVLVTDAGLVENKLVELPKFVEEEDLNRISQFLTQKFRGLNAEQIQNVNIDNLEREFLRYKQVIKELVDFLHKNIKPQYAERVYRGGTTNILDQPEFRDLDKVKALLDLLEKDEVISSVLMENIGKGITVSIGEENQYEEMKDCSVVTATYKIGEKQIGTIGVIGPTRMEYSKVIAVLDLTARTLSEVLTEMFT